MSSDENHDSGSDATIVSHSDSDSTVYEEPITGKRKPRTPKKGRRKKHAPGSGYKWPTSFPKGEGGPKTGSGKEGRKELRKA